MKYFIHQIYMKPKPGINSLHNLHGQLSGIHDFIAFLKSNKFEHDLRFSGIILFHTIGPKFRNEFSPL